MMERPKQRYVIDLTHLPMEIIKETEFKFPVVLVDLNENDLNYYLQNNETSIIKTEKEKKINKRGKSLENKYLLNMLNKGELKKKRK
jgi:hypothetical protein